MRTVLFHIVALLVTIVLYCLIVPQARTDLLSDAPIGKKLEDVGVRLLCVYVCFLFVYYAVFKSKASAEDMPDVGAYGDYDDAEDDAAAAPTEELASREATSKNPAPTRNPDP